MPSPQVMPHGLPYAGCPILDSDSFRLLQLQRSDADSGGLSAGTAKLEGQLVAFNVDSAPKYDALSYSWGEQSHFESLYFGSDVVLPVSRHLASALRCIRSIPETEHIWIDAICINQDDAKERSSQVSVMRNIYSRAQTVFVWLGTCSPAGMTIMSEGNTVYEHRWAGPDRDVNGMRLSYGQSIHCSTREPAYVIRFSHEVLQELFDLDDRAWWRRKWILQEVIVAQQEPIVLYGGHAFEFESFFGPQSVLNQHDSGLWGADAEMVFAPWDMRRFWTKSLAETSGSTVHAENLARLLRTTLASKVSDPRDHVYALLGLAHLDQRKALNVDYSLSPKEIFTAASRLFWKPNVQPEPWNDPSRQNRNAYDLFCGSHSVSDRLTFPWSRFSSPSWSFDFAHGIAPSFGYSGIYWILYSQDGSSVNESNDHQVKLFQGLEPDQAELDQSKDCITVYGIIVDEVDSLCQTQQCMEADRPWSELASRLQCSEKELDRTLHTISGMVKPKPRGFYGLEDITAFTTKRGHIGACKNFMIKNSSQHEAELAPGDLVVHLIGSTTTVYLRALQDGCYRLCDLRILSNDVCGCREGGYHDVQQLERFVLC